MLWKADIYPVTIVGQKLWYATGTKRNDYLPTGLITRPMKRIFPVSLSWMRNMKG